MGQYKILRETVRKYTLKILTRICRKPYNEYTEEFIELRDQRANDYIRETIRNTSNGLMISKWGTIELANVCSLLPRQLNIPLKDICEGKVSYDRQSSVSWLVNNSGFFPNSVSAATEFARMALEDAQEIDILGSYLQHEYYLRDILKNAVKVNLNGYYAPFLWKQPWTIELRNKKVLVVHPFAETIKKQYEKREFLF